MVHLESVVDEYGFITEQVIGQTEILAQCRVLQIARLGRQITIAADLGGAVQAATGETVPIGAGALRRMLRSASNV